jgi:hypothetical protein
MSSSSAHCVDQFSTPGVDTIAGVKIQRLPSGEALGSRDLHRWSNNRLLGRSGVSFGVEQTAAGNWAVTLPSGKTIDGFKSRRDAWEWIKQGRSRRDGGASR